jgi:hypothetical protein
MSDAANNISIEVFDVRPLSEAILATHCKSQRTLQTDILQEFLIVCPLHLPDRIRSKPKDLFDHPIPSSGVMIVRVQPSLVQRKHLHLGTWTARMTPIKSCFSIFRAKRKDIVRIGHPSKKVSFAVFAVIVMPQSGSNHLPHNISTTYIEVLDTPPV